MSARRARLACGAALLAIAATASFADDWHRYRFPRGECWTYDREVETSRDGRVLHSAGQTVRIWFLETRVDESDLWVEIAPRGDDRAILYAAPMTLNRAGRRRYPAELAGRLPDLEAGLEVLPGLAAALGPDDRWDSLSDSNGRVLRQRSAPSSQPSEGSKIEYDVIDSEGVDAFLGRSTTGVYTWDGAAGRVSAVEERTRLSSPPVAAVTRCRFVEAAAFSDTWRGRRIHEIERYLAAVRTETSWFARSERESIAPDTLLANVDRVWVEFLRVEPRDEDSPVRRAAESRRRELRAMADALRDRTRSTSQWLGTRAAPWSLLTPGGETLKSEELGERGLIEVFWSARSANALRSFAAIRAAAPAAAQRGVEIVCINLDTDVTLARRAIEACGSGLTHVLSGPPIGGESPHDLPIIRFLDAQRKVIRVQFGRRMDLSTAIRESFAD